MHGVNLRRSRVKHSWDPLEDFLTTACKSDCHNALQTVIRQLPLKLKSETFVHNLGGQLGV